MKIAVVGGGVSGLTALWALNQYSDHEVELFEKEDRLGGDACTIDFELPGIKEKRSIDLAFLLFNKRGWPNFCRILDQLGVGVEEAFPSISFSGDDGRFEWSSHSPHTLFATWKDLLNSDIWAMIFDIFRFNYFSLDVLKNPVKYQNVTVHEYIIQQGFSRGFQDGYLMPLLASMWSIPLSTVSVMPIVPTLTNMHNMAMLQLFNKPPWFAVQKGSREYINAVIRETKAGSSHCSKGVESISKDGQGVKLHFKDGSIRSFDHVIITAHSPQTAKILKSGGCITPGLDKALTQAEWTHIELVAHGDINLMPKEKRNWSGWNNLVQTKPDTDIVSSEGEKGWNMHRTVLDDVSCTFSLNNMLQHSFPPADKAPMLVSYNPHRCIDKSKIVYRNWFSQPSLTMGHYEAQRKLRDDGWCEENIPQGVSIIGAWKGLGTHEDGVICALEAIKKMGVDVPEMLDRDQSVPELGAWDHTARGMMLAVDWMRNSVELAWIWAWVLTLFALVKEAFGVLGMMGTAGKTSTTTPKTVRPQLPRQLSVTKTAE